jgi:SAM-dependent methyltransferase
VWAARHVAEHHPQEHVDVGSRIDYVAFLTTLTQVVFVDIRPLDAELDGLKSVRGSVLDLPFDDQSLESVSCLHVAEHIGLGRYGDALDPKGSLNAARELARVLAPGGQLLFSVPVGRPRTCFNAHRIFDPRDVETMFPGLILESFGGVDDDGIFQPRCKPVALSEALYAVGLYKFTRSP